MRRVPVNPDTMRQVLGHYPSGVTVVTSCTETGPVGFTCQSFHSLSLEPPMIVLLVSKASSSWPRIQLAGSFCVNILGESQASLCGKFAASGTAKFKGVSWTSSPTGSPMLDGCSAWVDCELSRQYDGGDHLIVTGNVHGMAYDPDIAPLVFHRGAFRTLSDRRVSELPDLWLSFRDDGLCP
jgi:3-hydroxy-9,10-secoandrosta-1,3,5(10)-triene-9,17-dione monooxygenase reductase component